MKRNEFARGKLENREKEKVKKNHTLSHHPEKTTYKHSVFSSAIRPLTLHPTPPPRLLFCIKPRNGAPGRRVA